MKNVWIYIFFFPAGGLSHGSPPLQQSTWGNVTFNEPFLLQGLQRRSLQDQLLQPGLHSLPFWVFQVGRGARDCITRERGDVKEGRQGRGGQWRGEGGEDEKQEGKVEVRLSTTGAGWMEEMKGNKMQAAWVNVQIEKQWTGDGDDDLREPLLSSSSPLWSSISTLPALLREYWSTLSSGFSRSCKTRKADSDRFI